ncbi:hypothetical protein HWV00_09470 [Moritella sp. 24]|uniref:hypothetical protein n=1 Tax=Moritella sp. 24 TaxID=2746230 RepID=UPI001BABD632|nr:hypothetical protein [Moritella sp. 24]QUM76435.1 hypothetical protein HWV00_09470 [Moritella sp. 24]
MSVDKYPEIDIPFDVRYTCLFCGEPSDETVNIPFSVDDINKTSHSPLSVPVCIECQSFVKKARCHSVYQYQKAVKAALTRKYQKALSIGSNWTEQELQESEFEGAAFEGFKRSAWMMYTIAKERINYTGWTLCLDGIPLVADDENSGFEFDGTRFVSVDHAVEHYIKTFHLDALLLPELVKLLGEEKFSYAIRVSRLYLSISAVERAEILADIAESLSEV